MCGTAHTARCYRYLENARELLNASVPGEFYVDRSKATVYYVPHPAEDLSTYSDSRRSLGLSICTQQFTTDLTGIYHTNLEYSTSLVKGLYGPRSR